MKKSITFFFPYYDVSGVPVLFLNLAEFIASHYNYHVYIIDYKDGYMARNREKKSKVKLIEFENGNFISVSDTILVMQAILPYAIRPELLISKKTKVFFWNLYPDIFFPFVFPFNFIPKLVKENIKLYQLILKLFYHNTIKKIRKFVTEMNDCKALIFMDSSNLDRTNEILELKLNPNIYLPILCKSTGSVVNKSVVNRKDLNISWVGRLCDFKVYILKYTIEKLAEIAEKQKKNIVFHVIGDGDKKYLIENISLDSKYFNLRIVGVIPKNQLDQYLIDNIDINAAMGTSALESAKLSIPTIVLDFSHQEIIGDYIFRWLHNTTNFDVGHNISTLDFKKDNKSLEKMLKHFEQEKKILENKSYQYFQNNHTIESVSSKLIQFVELYSTRFENIHSNYFKKSFLRRIYEYKRYKIWSQ